jgi:hypothetical protein
VIRRSLVNVIIMCIASIYVLQLFCKLLHLPRFLPLFRDPHHGAAGSNSRHVHPRSLEHVMAQHVCFALLVGCRSARSKVHGSVGARAPTLGEGAWVYAEDGVDDLGRKS